MEARVVIKKGPRKGELHRIQEGQKIVVGRSVHSDFQLLDEGLSRTHAMFENHGTYCEVSDLQSSNGTFLNAKKIKTAILRSGDIVKIGDAILEFIMGEPHSESGTTVRILDAHDSHGLDAPGGIKRRYDIAGPSELVLSDQKELQGEAKAIAKKLGTLYKITTTINSQKDLRDLFNTVIDSIMDEIPADRGFLLLRDDDQQIRPIVSRSRSDDPGEMVISHSILNEAVNNGNSVLTRDAATDERFSAGQSIMMHNIRSVMCVPLETFDKKILGALYLDTLTDARVFTEDDLEFLSAVGYQAGTAIERERLSQDLEDLMFSMVRTLVAAIEAKDEYTSGHSERVTAYSVLIAREMGFEEEVLEDIKLAGLLHDIGKIGIPENILNSSRQLTDDEWQIMRSHPDLSERILSKIRSDRMKFALDAAKFHHEKMDGSGYPEGMKGDEIPLVARIVSVADAYDAMTSNRRYRTNFDDERVLSEFKRCSGSHFDKVIVDAFLALHKRGEIIPLLSIGEDIYRKLSSE